MASVFASRAIVWICLPFNMYFGDRYTTGRQERCRQLMIAHRATLETLPFSQAKIKAGKLTGHDDIQLIVADGIVMLPCFDGSARKSVIFARLPQDIQDGQHQWKGKEQ